jgi:DNA-binding NtrC family response regulator
MDFDQKRTELLKNLSQQKHDSIMERRSIEAKNRIHEKQVNSSILSNNIEEKSNKPPVAIFGVKTPFITTLKSLLQQYCEIYDFYEIEKATEFLFSNRIPLAVLDMDPPNNSKDCTDFFSTGKTVNPDMQYIIYQKDEKPVEAIEVVMKQGAIVMRKPIDRMELVDLVKKFTAQWREKNASSS